jgi:Putative zincin peptidase
MRKPSIEELHNPNFFSLVESFKIDEMMLFLMKELGRKPAVFPKSRAPITRKMIRIVLLSLIGAFLGYFIGSQMGKLKIPFIQILWALGFMILVLLPIHEGIHAIVFKLLGAKKVGFGWTPKTLMVYAYSQKFVMTLKENAIVAIMPFLLISIALLSAIWAIPNYKILFISSMILHTYGCLGDFILINYYLKNRDRQMFTYDDLEGENMTYFFEKD